MRPGFIKQHLSAAATIALFVLAGLWGADPILARFSRLDEGQFRVDPSPGNVQIGRSALQTSATGPFAVVYQGIKEIRRRPIDLHFIIQFQSLHHLSVELTGDQGQTVEVGVLSPAEKWQYARDFFLDSPLLVRVELTETKAFLYAGKYAGEGIDLPDWPVTGIGIRGMDSSIAIFSVNAYAFREGIPDRTFIKTSGQYLPDEKNHAWLILLSAGLVGFLLHLALTLAFRSLLPNLPAGFGLIGIWAGFGLLWLFSWRAPDPSTIGVYLCSWTGLFVAVLLSERRQTALSRMTRRVLWILSFAALTMATAGLMQPALPCFLKTTFLFGLWAAVPLFGHFHAKTRHLNFPSGMVIDGISLIPLFLFGAGALFLPGHPYGLLIGLGASFSFSLRLALLFQNRKKAAWSQPVLLIAFLLLILSLETALQSALLAGPIPKFGTLLSADSRWIPESILKDEFLRDPKTRSPIFQDRVMATPKPPGETRIVFLGGSTTYGHPADSSLNFVSQIRERLEKDFPDRELGVYNCGYPGFGSLQMLLTYERYLRDSQVDLLVLYTLNNDMYQPGLFTYRELWQQPEAKDAASIREIRSLLINSALYRLAVGGHHSLLQGQGYAPSRKIRRDFKANLHDILTQATNRHTRVILIPEMIHPDLATQNRKSLAHELAEILKRLAESKDILFIETSKPEPSPTLFTDDVHLTAEGNRRLADCLYPAIENFVLSSKGE